MTHPLRRSSVGDVSYMEWRREAEGYGSLQGSDVNLYWSLG